VVREVSPKLLVNVNVPSPPDVFFTTVIDPGIVMVLVSNVTAPFSASAWPTMVAPVFSVMDINAKMFPSKAVLVPSVAELPTCQKTLPGWAPSIN
jgi:hypothetical protein